MRTRSRLPIAFVIGVALALFMGGCAQSPEVRCGSGDQGNRVVRVTRFEHARDVLTAFPTLGYQRELDSDAPVVAVVFANPYRWTHDGVTTDLQDVVCVARESGTDPGWVYENVTVPGISR